MCWGKMGGGLCRTGEEVLAWLESEDWGLGFGGDMRGSLGEDDRENWKGKGETYSNPHIKTRLNQLTR